MAGKTINKITKVKKRSGDIQKFDKDKIRKAVFKAITAAGEGDGVCSNKIANKVEELLIRRFKKDEIPSVEQIQDIVEEALILENLIETAKSYILYREQRRKIREVGDVFDESVGLVDKYLKKLDWQINENANMTYSLQGLNQYIVSSVAKKYWINKIYPKEIRDAAFNEDFHIHDLDSISTYCSGWDLHDLLERGFGGVPSKLECRPPRHFRTALGQLVNFFYTVQGEGAGAQAISDFDTLLAPFIRYDNLNYQQTKQIMQEFLYNCMVPTRVGFQTPFLNVSIDIKPPKSLADHPVMYGGQFQKEKYEEFQEEMNMFNRAFYECMMEGDAKGRPFTFPIPTINITKDFPWDNESLDPMWEATAKYGINYFANFIQGDMDPSDFRSMCCRLRLDNTELHKRGGGLFGSAPLTGSVGVVTVNMSRIGYTSKTQKEFYAKLSRLQILFNFY
jgi:ribonucleoside-triphosphate reductase